MLLFISIDRLSKIPFPIISCLTAFRQGLSNIFFKITKIRSQGYTHRLRRDRYLSLRGESCKTYVTKTLISPGNLIAPPGTRR